MERSMKRRLPLVLFALLAAGHAPVAKAQTPPPAEGSAAEAAAARAELERKALGLVEEALAEAAGLKLTENRVRAQAAAARVLWPRDAEGARAAFKAAADGVAALNAAVDTEDPQFYNSAQTAAQLRSELLQVAGQFDPKLALEFLRATRPAYAAALAEAGYAQPAQEQALEMNLAGQLAEQEPARALELAEESLRRAVTSGVMNVLQRLRMKDPAAASKLAGEIVRRLRAEDLTSSYEASAVAQQLLLLTRPADAAANSNGQMIVSLNVAAEGGAALLDEQTRRELAEKVLTAAAAVVPNQGGTYNLMQALRALLPEVEKYAPARAAALRRKAEELERSYDPQADRMRPYQEVMQSGSAEALLQAAPKAPAEVRDQLYMRAAWKSFEEGDAERARQILESVSNPQQRAQARRSIEQQAQWRASQQGNYAEARQYASRLRTFEERAQALLQIAGQASAAGDRQTARQLLEEARGLVEGQSSGYQQFSYRLQVAAAYAQFDPATSFEVVESAIARLDELLDAASVVDGFGQESFREGELRPQGGYMWNELINQCAQTLTTLSRSDFERASADAKKFRRAEARTTAELTLAQNILNGLTPAQSRKYAGPRRGYGFGKRD